MALGAPRGAADPIMSSARLESRLTRAWMTRGPLAWALLPLSWLFAALVGLRRGLYRVGWKRAERLPVPVVVVGNVFVGGTGKTPLTLWLVEALRAAGLHPGIVSRGYGRTADSVRLVTPDALVDEVGDEPLLLARRSGAPLAVGRRRAEAGRALLRAHPDVNVIVADDGLQHYALARDLELVLFDGRGLGNGWMLPAGPLREPASRPRSITVVNTPELTPALRASLGQGATIVAQPEMQGEASAAGLHEAAAGGGHAPDTEAAGPPWLFQMRLEGQASYPLGQPQGPLEPLAALRGKRLLAAAGIGNPERFFALLRAAGLAFEALPLPDHHDFRDDPFAGRLADCILITEKDAVKCEQIEHLRHDSRIRVVPVTASLDARLARIIVEKCIGPSPA
jgi:tetraacyldisaccharide 4'-kinase